MCNRLDLIRGLKSNSRRIRNSAEVLIKVSSSREWRVSGRFSILMFVVGAGGLLFLNHFFGVINLISKESVLVDMAALVSAMGALLGTFVGVAFAFGISGGGVAFRKFRRDAGSALVQTWTSLIYTSFSVSFLGLVAVTLLAFDLALFAISILGGTLFVIVVMAVNTVWIVKKLAEVGQIDDRLADQDEVSGDYRVKTEFIDGDEENARSGENGGTNDVRGEDGQVGAPEGKGADSSHSSRPSPGGGGESNRESSGEFLGRS